MNSPKSNRLNRHLLEVEESYTQHLRFALGFSGQLLLAAGACFIHALAPFVFEKTGSRLITRLYGRMVSHRQDLKYTEGRGGALA